jgi:hypothetical protein
MKPNLEQLTILPKSGDEKFHADDDLEFSIKDFWTWSASDLVSNVTRGHLAEFIVARAIGATENVRNEWAAYDLTTSNGIKIEVKSAAYLQSWSQNDYSTIQFNVEKTKALNEEASKYDGEPKRKADVYVFALLAHKDKPTVDPLNVKQWKFYVLPTTVLDNRERSQYSITLKSLIDLGGDAVDYFHLADKIEAVKMFVA